MTVFGGVDGGGTQTTVALSSGDGREIARVAGPAGLVDPRHPARSVGVVMELLRMAAYQAGTELPLTSLCAGLAGVGNEAERSAVQSALFQAGAAQTVRVLGDDEIALEGAFGGAPGILLIAGTGSICFGRAEDGRTTRSGGWGMVVGDEGSGFSIGRMGLVAALRGADGRGPPTTLLPRLLVAIGAENASQIPPWVGRATKSELAALAPTVFEAADEGDAVAFAVAGAQAREAARHIYALAEGLEPWSGTVPVVFHGGTFSSETYRAMVLAEINKHRLKYGVVAFSANPVEGALAHARRLSPP